MELVIGTYKCGEEGNLFYLEKSKLVEWRESIIANEKLFNEIISVDNRALYLEISVSFDVDNIVYIKMNALCL